MMNTLVIPESSFRRILRLLIENNAAEVILQGGKNFNPIGVEWLARDFNLLGGSPDFSMLENFFIIRMVTVQEYNYFPFIPYIYEGECRGELLITNNLTRILISGIVIMTLVQ